MSKKDIVVGWGSAGALSGAGQVALLCLVRDPAAAVATAYTGSRLFDSFLRHQRRGDPHEAWQEAPLKGLSAEVAGLFVTGVGALLVQSLDRSGNLSFRARLLLESSALLAGSVVRTTLRRRASAFVLRQQPRTFTTGGVEGDLVSIVLPAYRAESSIAGSVAAVADALYAAGHTFELIVVDDGSGDATAEVARSLDLKEGTLRVVAYEPNKGKGAAVRAGWQAASGASLGFTDADLAYAPSLLLSQLDALASADLVIGTRRFKGYDPSQAHATFKRRWASRGYHLLTRLVLVVHRPDTQAGIKLSRSWLAKQYAARGTIERFAFDVELLALAEEQRATIAEVPVVPRETEVSNVKVSFELVRTIWALLSVRRRQSLR